MPDYVAILIALTSLVISSYFAIKSMQSAARANELSESQKTAALIAILAPACQEPQQWKLFIEYLAKHNQLPNFSPDDEVFLANILNRLQVKARVVKGKLRLET